MTLLQLSEVAQKYYLSLKGNIVQGWEKYVLTNGSTSMFVKSDYEPKQGEAVFFLQMRQREVMCQLHRDGSEALDRYIIQPKQNLLWEVTDTETHVSVTFREALFEEGYNVSTPPNAPADIITRTEPIVREISEWLKQNHPYLYSCDIEARCSIIASFNECDGINSEDYWKTFAAALNGVMITGDEGIDIRFLIQSELEDFLAEQNPFNVEKDEMIGWFHVYTEEDCLDFNRTPEECWEIVNIIQSYWFSNRDVNQWARDITWWPTFANMK